MKFWLMLDKTKKDYFKLNNFAYNNKTNKVYKIIGIISKEKFMLESLDGREIFEDFKDKYDNNYEFDKK
jgi:hypothetical protein